MHAYANSLTYIDRHKDIQVETILRLQYRITGRYVEPKSLLDLRTHDALPYGIQILPCIWLYWRLMCRTQLVAINVAWSLNINHERTNTNQKSVGTDWWSSIWDGQERTNGSPVELALPFIYSTPD